MGHHLVVTKDLTKRYGNIKALNGVSLVFPKGINGLLGPNGAGKTTLISLLLGTQKPTTGELSVLGYSPRNNLLKIKEKVGWAPEEDFFDLNIIAKPFLIHMGELGGLKRITAAKRLSKLATIFEVEEAIHRKLSTLSLGLKQKMKLIGALIHDPELLILDEPLQGLDPSAQETILRLIEKIAYDMDKDLIIATHRMEVAQITDHTIVLNGGNKIFSGRTSLLMNEESGYKLRIGTQLADHRDFATILEDHGFPARFKARANYIVVQKPAKMTEKTFKRELLQLIEREGVDLNSFRPIDRSIQTMREPIEGENE